ncbi:thioredoxin 1 [Elusimicrobium posterum]|uniref:thioredoxin family protein n=1 Tax=Elusimicrobium posterum TaxID=3116653 RepID=UPI003C77834E
MNMIQATDEDLHEIMKKQTTPYMVEFFATWCGHCKRMEPILQQAAKEYAGKVTIIQMDVDQTPKMNKEFGVSSTPTMFFYDKNGEMKSKQVGELPLEDVKAKFDSLL